MTDPEVHEAIEETISCFPGIKGDFDSASLAHAVIGALATRGFAVVHVEPEVVRRVLSELSRES